MSAAVGFALVVGLAGCNIFGQDDPPTLGQNAPELREKLDTFLATGSEMELTSDEIYEIAKQNRRASGVGVLSMARQISNTESAFPFEELDQVSRLEKAEPLLATEKCLGLMLYANKYGSEAQRRAMSADSDLEQQLQSAAERVTITEGMDPCGFYADYIAAKIVRITIGFRRRLEIAIPGVQVVQTGSGPGYTLDYSNTSIPTDFTGMTPAELLAAKAELEALQSAIQGVFIWFGGELDIVINVIAGSDELFGCDNVLLDSSTEENVLLSLKEMRNYIDTALRNIDFTSQLPSVPTI